MSVTAAIYREKDQVCEMLPSLSYVLAMESRCLHKQISTGFVRHTHAQVHTHTYAYIHIDATRYSTI